MHEQTLSSAPSGDARSRFGVLVETLQVLLGEIEIIDPDGLHASPLRLRMLSLGTDLDWGVLDPGFGEILRHCLDIGDLSLEFVFALRGDTLDLFARCSRSACVSTSAFLLCA